MQHKMGLLGLLCLQMDYRDHRPTDVERTLLALHRLVRD